MANEISKICSNIEKFLKAAYLKAYCDINSIASNSDKL